MTTNFIPSDEQQAYFDWIDTGRGSLILEAVAGAGKTETLARGLSRMTGSVAIMMFNRDAAIEFKDRVKRIGADTDRKFIGTCHSFGLGTWKRFDKGFNPDTGIKERKTEMIIEAMTLEPDRDQDSINLLVDATPYIKRMVSFGKQLLAGVKWDIHNPGHWERIADRFGTDSELPEGMDMGAVNQALVDVFLRSGKMCRSTPDGTGILDYDDMIWAPLAHNARFFTNDWVLGDEWQDANPARLELARRMLRPGGRFVGVGDRHQAIYVFTGADSKSLDKTAELFKCSHLGLTITRRCPKAVVAYAHKWVSHIQAHDEAPIGEVRAVMQDKPEGGKAPRPWYLVEDLQPDHAILCRYNKPLVTTAFALLKEGIACKMAGRDVGNGLIALAKRWKVRTLDLLEKRLEQYRGKEVAKARAKKSEAMEQSVNDRIDCLLVFVERCRAKGATKIDCVVQEIQDLFADDTKGVLTLSSGHKAKGREWPRVYWLQVPAPKRELKDWEQEAETNLSYVITTRAKETLVLVSDGAR